MHVARVLELEGGQVECGLQRRVCARMSHGRPHSARATQGALLLLCQRGGDAGGTELVTAGECGNGGGGEGRPGSPRGRWGTWGNDPGRRGWRACGLWRPSDADTRGEGTAKGGERNHKTNTAQTTHAQGTRNRQNRHTQVNTNKPSNALLSITHTHTHTQGRRDTDSRTGDMQMQHCGSRRRGRQRREQARPLPVS